MASASETDLTATPPWARSSFSNTFKRKVRKNKGSETASLKSGGGDVLQNRRASVDAGESFGRQDSNSDSSRKLSTILGGIRRTGDRKRDRTESESGSESLSRSATEGSGALATSAEDLSNYTDDDEAAEPTHQRPSLSPHQSHTGYLTLSSPLIASETLAQPPLTTDGSQQSLNNTTTSRSDTLRAPVLASQRRSPSPVGRLKDAFRPLRRSSAATPKSALENNQSGDTGGGLESTIGGRNRRGSVDPQGSPAPVVFQDRQLVEELCEKTPSPHKPRTSHTLFTNIPATPPSATGPATFVTPPTPTAPIHRRDPSTPTAPAITTPKTAHTADAGTATTQFQESSHRRQRSGGNQPSKLSSSISAPLTPAIEEVKTPGGTLSAPTAAAAGGFFQSMFSAAQNAATSLTSTITSGPGQRSRSGTGADSKLGETGGEEVILPPSSTQKVSSSGPERKQLAIETLGAGNLSLSHLGISESSDISPMNSSTDLVSGIRRDEISARAEDDAAARAVSMAYTENMNGDTTSAAPSVIDHPDQTPSRSTVEQEISSIKRAGSVRSRLSNRRRRTRGSSAATGITMAPVISGPGVTAQKLTGFAVANSKRNKDFHNLFRSVPEDDFLIEDYSAALQRDILLQGRIYISEGHICFSSNILGWVTNLVISFDEIISVEKKSTAIIFNNGIIIQTLQAKNVFASLLNRDTTYELIIAIWKITHPNLKSSLNGAPVDGLGTGDKTEKVGSVAEEESASEEVYDEDDEDEDEADEAEGSVMEANEGSTVGSETADVTRAANRKASTVIVGTHTQNGMAKVTDALDSVLTGASATLDFPGPPAHVPSDCGDQSSHLERLLIEEVIPAPLGKIYSLMFGPASGAFMRKWLVEDQKSLDLQLEDDKKGLDQDKKTMSYSYIKPLSGAIGPKQTKCIINQTLEQFDLNKAVTVACSTQNPDVPSGNIFVVKTRYCLMWAPGNATKYVATCQIEWSGKSWLKGPIEKGANDGQLQYQKDIVTALKGAVAAKSQLKIGAKGKGKNSKRRKESSDAGVNQRIEQATGTSNISIKSSWGVFEPFKASLGPVASVVSPSLLITFLTFMVFFLSWRLSTGKATSELVHGVSRSPQRTIAYDELWRKEESELWNWLEERAGIEGAIPGFLTTHNVEKKRWIEEQRAKALGKRVGNDVGEMKKRQMEEAIRVTKERLGALEKAISAREG